MHDFRIYYFNYYCLFIYLTNVFTAKKIWFMDISMHMCGKSVSSPCVVSSIATC